MRKSHAIAIAIWSAAVFGFLEGLALYLSRPFPAVLAAHKVSADVLWVAPAVDLPLFLLAAGALLVLSRLARRGMRAYMPAILYGSFAFLGFFTVLTAPVVLHPLSAGLLALGLALVLCRSLRNFEPRLTARLGRLVWIPPLVVLATGLSVLGCDRAQEAWRFRHLPAAPLRASNVLLIVLDTVRFDSFSRPERETLTPNLDRITAQGTRFENAWATSSWSLPSQTSILVGRYPHEHGADWPNLKLQESLPTLAEFMAERGYVTGAFSSNAAWVTPEYLGRGFLRFEVYVLEDLLRRTVHGRKIDRLLQEVRYHYAGRGKVASKLNAHFLSFLDRYRTRPFFAYLCYMDVNRTFQDRQLNSYFGRMAPAHEVVEAYELGLRELDARIGDLFAELERRGKLDDTLVIVTSDHGESFGDEAAHDHEPAGHATSLYPEQVRVPLFVVYRGKVPAGRRVAQTVSLGAIPTTVARLLKQAPSLFGGEPLPLPPESGESEGTVLATLNYDKRKLRSVIQGRWQYIRNLGSSPPTEELYDLAADSFATVNLTLEEPGVVASSRGHLQRLLTSLPTAPVRASGGRSRGADPRDIWVFARGRLSDGERPRRIEEIGSSLPRPSSSRTPPAFPVARSRDTGGSPHAPMVRRIRCCPRRRLSRGVT